MKLLERVFEKMVAGSMTLFMLWKALVGVVKFLADVDSVYSLVEWMVGLFGN